VGWEGRARGVGRGGPVGWVGEDPWGGQGLSWGGQGRAHDLDCSRPPRLPAAAGTAGYPPSPQPPRLRLPAATQTETARGHPDLAGLRLPAARSHPD
jgi:hypothetical protein